MKVFQELRELAALTRHPEQREEGRDRLIRFLDAHSGGPGYATVVDSLCIHFGLYPYVSRDRTALSTSEVLAWEKHRPPVDVFGPEFAFHADQARVFHRLMDGNSVMLSAPTSFGKSAILDALVSTLKWSNIVVIVPTIALIDEIRRRLVRFSEVYTIVTHPTQHRGDRNVYVLTQERFLEMQPEVAPDLFMIDEFYKLSGMNEDDQRTSMLNIAWKQLRDSGAQFYLTGPNIDSLADSLDEELLQSLYVSRYRTVAVDIEDRSHIEDDARIKDIESMWVALHGATLVFVSSPARAERVGIDIASFKDFPAPSALVTEVAGWVSENYHPEWRVAIALNHGLGVHSGPMPRSLQRIMVRLFADGNIPALVCTTTLIEGVNTTAKNVIVYDKKIDKKPIDYFTFSNVRGRAGRMSNHYVGRVVTYMPPPAPKATEVDIPIESQPPTAQLSSLIHVAPEDLNGKSRERLGNVMDQRDLSLRTIRLNRGFDPERQIEVARLLIGSKSLRARFGWSGYPTNAQLRAVLKVGIETLLLPRQRRGMNVDRIIGTMNAVRETRGDLKALVDRQFGYRFPNEDLSDVVSNVLAFQRNVMGFTIPSLLKALQRIYNDVTEKSSAPRAGYDFYVSQVEHQFLDPHLLSLDEYGLPLPLAIKFSTFGMTRSDDLDEVLVSFAALARRPDIRSRLTKVELWIVDDVLAGVHGSALTQDGCDRSSSVQAEDY